MYSPGQEFRDYRGISICCYLDEKGSFRGSGSPASGVFMVKFNHHQVPKAW